MVIAITTGIVLASLLFMKQVAEMTKVHDITDHKKLVNVDIPQNWKILKINGPLFFAAADSVFSELSKLSDLCFSRKITDNHVFSETLAQLKIKISRKNHVKTPR